jgi:hypothetical protein
VCEVVRTVGVCVQCARQCEAVRVLDSVWQCGSACVAVCVSALGSAWQCVVVIVEIIGGHC